MSVTFLRFIPLRPHCPCAKSPLPNNFWHRFAPGRIDLYVPEAREHPYFETKVPPPELLLRSRDVPPLGSPTVPVGFGRILNLGAVILEKLVFGFLGLTPPGCDRRARDRTMRIGLDTGNPLVGLVLFLFPRGIIDSTAKLRSLGPCHFPPLRAAPF